MLVGSETFDKVLVTTSPGLMAKLCPELPESYLKGLLELKSMGAVVMVMSLKHQLSEEGYYWFNLPKGEGFPFLALVEHTNYRLGGELWRRSHFVCRGLSGSRARVFLAEPGRIAEAFCAGIQAHQPEIRAGLGEEGLGVQDRLRATCAAGEPLEEYPGHRDAGGRAVFRFDEPGLPLGSGNKFRSRDRAKSGKD